MKQAKTLPQRVASTMARTPYIDDWQLLRDVVNNFYHITFERPPENTGEVVAIMKHLPTFDQIGRARRNAQKNNLISQWRDYYDSPTRELKKFGASNIPYEYQRLDDRDEL